VPVNIREVKGSFYTPKIWADKSKEYIARVFGDNWQEEYYVWDCAAGTGNLLAGLSNKYKVWASTLDQSDVDTINALIDIDEQLNLLPNHVFQFDFLNDGFDKLPEGLRNIIADDEKRKKLIVYINPPYAEAMNRASPEKAKTNVSKTKKRDQYLDSLGKSSRELFIQFLTRIYLEIQNCKIAEFSKLKALNSPNFKEFRLFFLAKLEKMFAVPAHTFDNVKGPFPIGFKIWDTAEKEKFSSIESDIFDEKGNNIGTKRFFIHEGKNINHWLKQYVETKDEIGAMCCKGTDFQNVNFVNINLKNRLTGVGDAKGITKFIITKTNLIEAAIYYTVRHCIPATWLNDRDQFLYPNDGYKNDADFQNDCLINILFNNNIQSQYGTNHWIPFTPEQVDAKEMFESNFMSNFLKDKTLSTEAQSVYNAGLAVWKYYHAKTKNNNSASVNASFYDIREYFQGRNDKGTMNSKSTDETYTQLLGVLRDALKTLTQKIQPKVYAYGFLRE
jgi:hypothetical protein